jgi:hypothetical protein
MAWRSATAFNIGGGLPLCEVAKGPASYSATNGDNDIPINGKKLDLSSGDVFTVEIKPDGTSRVRPGAP